MSTIVVGAQVITMYFLCKCEEWAPTVLLLSIKKLKTLTPSTRNWVDLFILLVDPVRLNFEF